MESAFRSTTRFLLVLVALAGLAGTMWAQGGTAELSGLVTDPTGAVVPGVQVTLSNSATGEKRTTTSTAGGVYRFSALPVVGTYTIESAPKGFKSVKIQNIIVSVGTTTSQDVKLELGQGSEQITVEAGAQMVQTEDASVSQLVDRRAWESTPLEARSQNELINLVAGATPEAFNNTGRGASVNGTRSGTGNYLVEGADNNEQGQGGVALQGPGGANTTISPDAIQEYRVITNDFPAEYGKAGGFVTDTVLKSGTNQWHGSAFEYNRTQAYTAQDWFSNSSGTRDHLVRNQFGGSLGGPIIKDKTFFFGTGEIHRLRQGAPVTATGTTQSFLDFVNSGGLENFMENDANGICNNQSYLDAIYGPGAVTASPCPGAFNLQNQLGSKFQTLLAAEPGAFPLSSETSCGTDGSNCLSQGAWTGGLISYPVPVYGNVTKQEITNTDQARFSFKVDHKLTSKDQLSGVYLFDDVQVFDNNAGGATTIGPDELIPSRAQNAAITWTRTLSNSVLNQARIGYLRRVANFTSPGTDGVPSIFTFVDPLGTGFGASAGIPQFFTENQFQYKDDLSITKGKHNFKTGFEYRRTRNGSSFFNDRNGTVAAWSVEDILTDYTFTDQLDNFLAGGPFLGSCAACSASINPSTGTLPEYYRGYRANEFGAYGQDDWRITPRLTLNLGVRWEYFGPPHNFLPNTDSNFYFGPATVPIATTSTNPYFPINNPFFAREATGTFQVRDQLWNKDTNNFGPRFGFSYDLFGNQKVVLRGGFAVAYDRIYNNLFENIRFNPPFFSDAGFGFFNNGVAAGDLATPGFYQLPFVANTNGFMLDPNLFPVAPKASPRHMDENLVAPYYEQMHFGVQYELAKDLVLETNYIGTLGRKLTGILNLNTFDGRTSGLGSRRPNTTINSDNFRTNAWSSNYHGLQMSLRKRYSFGLQFNANYTFSKALDQLSDAFRAKALSAFAAGANSDYQNLHLDYAPADFDTRHRVVVSYNYDVPFLRTNRWLGGWQLNGVFSFQTGVPIPIYDPSNDSNRNGNLTDRPEYAAGFHGQNTVTNSQSPAIGYLDQAAFVPTDCGTADWCNSTMHRNDVYGPHYINLDFGLGKSFKVTESAKFTFFANFFNIFNHPNFNTPVGNFTDPNFGKSVLTIGNDGTGNGHRIGQLALRFDF